MKGILLAGGRGTRLFPLTIGVSKQLLPVFDKPLIYYPLSVLMLAGIRDIMIITSPEAFPALRTLLKDGSQWGLEFTYREQSQPRGLADAFIIGRAFIGNGSVCLILGDNIFFGQGLSDQLRAAGQLKDGATIFTYSVKNPEQYGVIELDSNGTALSIEEKPKKPKSTRAITGIYFCDHRVSEIASGLKPSARGELEITDVIRAYLELGLLRVETLGRGAAWLDAGTPESIMQAANFVQAVQERQGMMISSPEEISFRQGFISAVELRRQAMGIKNPYGDYLLRIAGEDI